MSLRLALLAILHGKDRELVLVIGLVCSTWVSICRGSSLRNWVHAMGDPASTAIQEANLMTSRAWDSLPGLGRLIEPFDG